MSDIEKEDVAVQEEIIQLKGRNLPNQEIANQINSKYSLDLTERQISYFINNQEDNFLKVLKENGEFGKKMAEKFFNDTQQLNRLNGEMWEFFMNAKKDPQFSNTAISCPHCHRNFQYRVKSYLELVKIADHLLNQIKQVQGSLTKIQKENITINYNVPEINGVLFKALPNILKKLENQGSIKVIKKKLLNPDA